MIEFTYRDQKITFDPNTGFFTWNGEPWKNYEHVQRLIDIHLAPPFEPIEAIWLDGNVWRDVTVIRPPCCDDGYARIAFSNEDGDSCQEEPTRRNLYAKTPHNLALRENWESAKKRERQAREDAAGYLSEMEPAIKEAKDE
jgi:hypothetical protein